ncbi:MAG: hypothetical protein HKN87_18705 [Saprospiraceae bacterium]|nr:hypothetical protein [Saprospiraceae bacterium]
MGKRKLSIDVLRGMTIFFMIIVNSPGSWEFVYRPLRHAPWNGCTPTDLVFPFFVFIVGLSMSYSFRKYHARERSAWVKKIVSRTLLIFLVGLLLNWFPFFNKSIADLRIFGVLQRIALAYGLGGMLIIFLAKYYKWAFAVVLLLYWWLLIQFGGIQPLSLEENAVRYLDLFLWGDQHLYHGYGLPFDPEGLLSALPAVGTVLFGFYVGKTMQAIDQHPKQIRALTIIGLTAAIIGMIWHYLGFPINKPLWSSSYVLFSGGLACLFLAVLIFFIDHLGYRKWTYVFRAFGLNPLISYVLSGLILKTLFLIKIGEVNLYGWLYVSVFQSLLGDYLGSLVQAISYTMFIWLFAWWLYAYNRVIKL